MMKTAIFISTATVAGITLPTVPVPISANAHISYLNIEISADGFDASLTPSSKVELNIAFTGDRLIRIGA